MIDKKKIVEQWIKDNGAASFDFKKKDIWLWDGGLFSVEKEPVMRSKVIGHKKLPNGMTEVLFSKKKYKDFDLKAVFWMEELDETINYFQRMKKMLNKLGYKTGHKHGRK